MLLIAVVATWPWLEALLGEFNVLKFSSHSEKDKVNKVFRFAPLTKKRHLSSSSCLRNNLLDPAPAGPRDF